MTESPLRIGDEPTPEPGVFDPPTPAETRSDVSALEALREKLQAPVETEPVVINVPGRPGITIRCHTRMTQEERKAWQKRSEDRKTDRRRRGQDSPIDEMKFACLVLANTCEAILVEGEEALDDNSGAPLTFASRQLWDMVGAAEPSRAIRNLFGIDAHVLIASGEVILASGFDDDLEVEEGPTT
jgi:hypothetical protein